MNKTKVNGTEINYELHGAEGRPWLVLSHSLACSTRMWDPQIEAFQSKYRILAYDMRGHGKSAAPSGAYSLDMLADDVLGLMKELGVKRATFIGLSIGGMIGQTLALRQTGLFDGMVLADTTHTQPPEAVKQWEDRIRIAESQGMKGLLASTMERWFTASFRNSPAAKKIGELILATPVAGYVGCGKAIMKLDTTARLKEIKLPVLAITGAEDGAAGGTRHIGETVPGAKFVSIPNASHIANVEQPAAFTGALREFLSSLPSGRA
jgi:3-oxoadipate enol-lactonase